ncbi:MAG TPA: PDZ domain-containing protein [Pyrinomonadaceae bacterium]
MQTEAYREANDMGAQGINTCPNCHALMPNELRFCRACGCRLGEGVEEYTETVRFDSSAQATARSARAAKTASTVPPKTAPTGIKDWGAMKPMTMGLGGWKMARSCSRRVPKWMVWVFLPIIAISIMGGMSSRSNRSRGRAAVAAGGPDSYIGAEYKTAPQGVAQGVFVRDVKPAGSAADKAGLLGGDIITSFDGKPVKSDNELSNLLSNTPIGKTVDVTFNRDGETKTVKLVTVSEDENDNLREAFENSPQGFLGVEDNFQRVQVPGMNIYGVQLKKVYKNQPAYMAGLQDGDIVIEFNGTPIRTTEEFNDRIDRAAPNSTVKVVIMRGTDRKEIMVKMGIDD